MKLGLLFLKRTDKQGWFRYLVMVVAISLAMVALLSSLALGNALSIQRSRQAWISQIALNRKLSVQFPLDQSLQDKTLFVYRMTDFDYKSNQKQTINEIGMRQISQHSPLIPGLKRQPKANEVFVSPALFQLIKREPTLQNRYAKYQIKLGIPNNILISPDSKLAIYRLSDQWLERANQPGKQLNQTVSAFGNSDLGNFSRIPETRSQMIITTFMLICGLGICFPMLILLISAMRIGMVQREQRYAALSLLGASKRQVNKIILSEALASTGIGVICGLILYKITRVTILANLKFGQERFFLQDITLDLPLYLGTVALIFLVVILVNAIALRKVKSSPLGVVKIQKLPRKPSILGLLPLVIAVISIWQLTRLSAENWYMKNAEIGMLWFAATFVVIMIGLLTSGAFLTRLFANLLSFCSRKMTGLMIAKHLQKFAKATFSSVSGVVLALFVSSFFMTTIASVEVTYGSIKKDERAVFDLEQKVQRDNTVEVIFQDESSKVDREAFLAAIIKQPNLKTIKSYHQTYYFSAEANKNDSRQSSKSGNLYSCKDLQRLTKLACPKNLQAKDQVIVSKNYETNQITLLPFDPNEKGVVSEHSLMFVFDNNTKANLGREYIRNIAYNFNRNYDSGIYIQKPSNTIFDALAEIAGLVELIVFGTAISIVVAGFGVAVATIGQIFERKKSFSNLRLMGVDLNQLRVVVLLEAIIPMLLASIGAIFAGILTSKYLAGVTAGNRILFAWPKLDYLGIVALALALAIGVICLVLPILKQITSVEQNRTE